MTPPRWVWLPALLGLAFIVVPLTVMAAGIHVARLPALLGSPASVSALRLSLGTAALSTLLCLLFGLPLALVLARSGRSSALLRTVVLVPLVLPPVVSGLALLSALGRRGAIGAWLDALGFRVAFTTGAVVLAQAFVALPFLVLAVEGALRSTPVDQERAAAVLGASPTRVLWWVTLPRLRAALVGGVLLAFARCLGEFGATLTFAGSLQGVTRTMPLEIYLQRESDPQAAVALSLLLIVIAVAIVALAYGRSVRGEGGGR